MAEDPDYPICQPLLIDMLNSECQTFPNIQSSQEGLRIFEVSLRNSSLILGSLVIRAVAPTSNYFCKFHSSSQALPDRLTHYTNPGTHPPAPILFPRDIYPPSCRRPKARSQMATTGMLVEYTSIYFTCASYPEPKVNGVAF